MRGTPFFICGSALRGQPDHGILGDARFLGDARTAPKYRMVSVNGSHPGIYETASGGVSIAGELYELTDAQYRNLIAAEPPDLYEAPVELLDGSKVSAMLYPFELIELRGFHDISEFGGWRAFRTRSCE
jgi:gamma-glutamylaminecyclotransferase